MVSHRLLNMSIRSALYSCAFLTFVITQPAFAVDTVSAGEMTVSHAGDMDLGCAALSKEAGTMRDVITQHEDVKDDAKMQGYGVNAAAGIGSFLVGTVTGGIGFAAAGLLASEAISEEAEEAEAVKDIAAQRRSFMMGVFNAKGCFGPIEHVMLTPQEERTQTSLANIEPAAGDDRPRYND